jgi:hypothetical protein
MRRPARLRGMANVPAVSVEVGRDTPITPSGNGSTAAATRRQAPFPQVGVSGLVLLAWVPCFVYFLGLKPGLMSNDSLDSWRQVTEGPWTDAHPPPYTALMGISAWLVSSPSLLTLGQSLLLVASVVFFARSLHACGAPLHAVVVATAVVVASPQFCLFAMSLWKDIPFVAGQVLLASVGVRHLGRRQSHSQWDGRQQGLFIVAGLICVLMRQNGVLFFGALSILYLACMKGARRQLLVGIAVVGLAFVGVKVALYPVLGVEESPSELMLASFLHDMTTVAAQSPASLDLGEKILLEEAAPLEDWAAADDCYWIASFYSNPQFELNEFAGRERDVLAMWWDSLTDTPGLVVGHRACAASIAWRPDSIDDAVSVLYTVSPGIDANGYGLVTSPVVDGAQDFALASYRLVETRRWQWLTWRAPTWIYAAYIVVGITALRMRDARLVLFVAPLLAQQATVLVLNPAQDARYMFGALVLAVLTLPVIGLSPASQPVPTK